MTNCSNFEGKTSVDFSQTQEKAGGYVSGVPENFTEISANWGFWH
jgi:hypothetical protein